jgi:hypothetical protein
MMNEIELQGIVNGLTDLAGRMRQTRLRLASGISDPASPAQESRFTAALGPAADEIRLLLDYFGTEQLPPWERPHPFETSLPEGGKCDICGRDKYDGIHPTPWRSHPTEGETR